MMKKQRLLTLALSCACVFTSAVAVGIWSLDTEKANAAWTNDAGKASSQKSAVVYEYEDYVVAQNDDFGGATTLSWGGDATSGLTLKNDLPTASFVYKFSYTPNSGGQTALALRSAYWGDYHFVFKGKTLQYNLKAGYVAVGEVFEDGAQLVEVGAIEIKNSDLTWFFLKVNGEEKMSATAANVPNVKGISAWGDETGVIAQYSYDVSFNGEVKEVLAGQAIGALPETPANENELLGWFDQDGNQVTAETVVTKDLTVTAVFAEPHNVTFTVDGEVYETYENVAYNTAIGKLPVAPKKAGHDFVKWTCGGEEVTAETVVSEHMTVVAEYAERGYYLNEELEDYVVAQNDDFGGAAALSWGSDATSNLKLTNTTATASFVYKFNFTPNDGSGQTALALRSFYWGSYYFVFKAKTLWYHLNSADVKVGEVFTDGAQVVEVGAIDIKDSNLTWFFLKVNGEIKMSATASDVPDKKGISIWGPQAVFAQYSYDVSFNGEVKEVLAGQAIGALPETPANENELLGWFDQDGNQVTAETVVTKDLTVTAVFAEPHNVTFTVDGEVYETYENVAYNTAIGKLPVAPKKAGHDFVKWTCGGEEVTAETIVSTHMTVVAEYAERGYYIDEELEDYVVAQNDDFGGAAALSWGGGDATSGLTLKNDLPTASFVYKFSYTPNDGGQTALALRSSYWGAYLFLFQGKKLMYNLNADYVTVGEVFEDGAQLVEVGAIEIKNSDLTWFFLKVNGEEKMSVTAANVPDVKGISAWGDETAVLSQYSWTVDFNGEKKEVLNGAAIGELPAAPESEFEIIGWADQYGNILTAETVAKENITATPVFNEPHTVTFVVNGQTLATVENVGYKETVTIPECSVPGYDFVKWVYGDNEEFTAETQVVSNLTITAVLTARDFTEEELADYITITNKDIGAAASIKNTNSSFTNYKIATENETSSVVYQFVYEKGEKPLYIVVRDIINGWGTNADGSAVSGYTFILLGAKMETPVDKLVADAFSGEASLYLVEIGVIDVKDSNEVWIYVKVNGNKIVDGRMEKCANVSNYIGMFGDDASTSTINEADDYHLLEGIVEKHTVVEVEGLAATCTEAGYTAHSYCEVCNASLVAKEILDALGHEEETVEGYAATCTETGLTDGAVCTVCGETTVAQTEIGMLGHDVQTVEAVAPGCETVGATAGEKCIHEGCDLIVSGCEEVPATGHTEVKDEAVASTCIERGKSEGSHCGTCGKILQEQESLPLADHNYVDGVCSVCGDEDISAVAPGDSSNGSTDENNVLSGCFGSIGGAFSGVIMAIGATFLCVKKKKEEK